MWQSQDPVLNPVYLWADTVKSIRVIPGCKDSWTVDTILEGNLVRRITSAEVGRTIKAAVQAIGVDTLGFTKDDVGTHSNRSACAMAMYLANVPVYTIML
eukprot:824302-Ditylum_brightwellii.AAC.1